ncbi:MAG: YggT family protein [Microbacteriaceae bacterium]|nr:YggT family protein [Microbacteriaceae bacterium]
MKIVSFIATVCYVALLIYFFLLWARFLLDLARNFSRGWRPRGVALVLAEIAYTLTDPPIKLVRKLLPPIRVGAAALDFSWSIVMIAIIFLMYFAIYFS